MRRLFEGGPYLKIGRDKEKETTCTRLTGNRKREVGLLVPAKFTAFTTEPRIARILEGEFNGRAEKYNYFEVKKITFDEKKFPVLF